ncbi:hypothetical protein SlGVgp072 [Spodoptera litura granulovirus]|uniref:Uncharacterized protein n=1 Tax=Spodoptera litura granulovirus TaxID=359919 RepID=A5IZS4_9BBAC|nr:hypothetical protein SlGVgp072 [Spodoptera litura granulovirus]ABQ52015.1 hypothetical protein SlGVgp072 [Spodoptera litura granulovirus]
MKPQVIKQKLQELCGDTVSWLTKQSIEKYIAFDGFKLKKNRSRYVINVLQQDVEQNAQLMQILYKCVKYGYFKISKLRINETQLINTLNIAEESDAPLYLILKIKNLRNLWSNGNKDLNGVYSLFYDENVFQNVELKSIFADCLEEADEHSSSSSSSDNDDVDYKIPSLTNTPQLFLMLQNFTEEESQFIEHPLNNYSYVQVLETLSRYCTNSASRATIVNILNRLVFASHNRFYFYVTLKRALSEYNFIFDSKPRPDQDHTIIKNYYNIFKTRDEIQTRAHH